MTTTDTTTPRDRLKAIALDLKPITAKALDEQRDFTPDEQRRVVALLDEAKAIREQLDRAEKAAGVGDRLRDFLTKAEDEFELDGSPDARPRHDAPRPRRKSYPSWERAMLDQNPHIRRGGGKAISMPPIVSFQAPTPGPIIAQNVPFGHLLDVVEQRSIIGASGVSFLRATSRTFAADVVAPGALKPSRSAGLERIEAPARTIAVLLEDIRKQDLEDVQDLVRWIDFELRADVLHKLDQQMLLGNGTGEQFDGIFYSDGILVQNYDTTASRTLRLGIAAVEAAGYGNTAVALNPVDYAKIELEQNTAGAYRGDRAPTSEEPGDNGPRTLWGVPVASVPSVPAGLAVTGDFTQVVLWVRDTTDVTITETNEDDFKRNLFLARAEMRAAFAVQTPGALAVVKLNGTVTLPSGA